MVLLTEIFIIFYRSRKVILNGDFVNPTICFWYIYLYSHSLSGYAFIL